MKRKFNIGDIVIYKGGKRRVIDIVQGNFYDLEELDGCGEYIAIPEAELIEVDKSKYKEFRVHYSFYLSDAVVISAETEEEAEMICQKMIENGDIGNLNEMDIGDSKVWID